MKTLKKTNQGHKNCQIGAYFSIPANPTPLLAVLICFLILVCGCQSPQQPTFEERFQVNKRKAIRYFYDIAQYNKKVEKYLKEEKEREEEYLQNLK